MTIRDILCSALRRIGREDIAIEVESGGEPDGEAAEVVETLLYCINATEDELARYYFPLKCTETLYSENKLFYFADFLHAPVKIVSVKWLGKDIPYEVKFDYLAVEAKQIEITYLYTPPKKSLDEKSEYGDIGDGQITALGAAAEYCLICGEASLAEVWETRYREAIDRAQKAYSSSVYIPPRRWI